MPDICNCQKLKAQCLAVYRREKLATCSEFECNI